MKKNQVLIINENTEAEVIGIATGEVRKGFLRRVDGSIYMIRSEYFVETGGSSAGRIGCWVTAQGKPVDNFEPDVIAWGDTRFKAS